MLGGAKWKLGAAKRMLGGAKWKIGAAKRMLGGAKESLTSRSENSALRSEGSASGGFEDISEYETEK